MRSIALVLIAGLGLGCAASQRAPVAARPAAGQSAPPDAASAVAQEAVDARVTMLLHLDRMRGFRFARLLVQLGAWNILASDVGIDAFDDVERAFIAARASHTGQVAVLLQHTASEARVAEAIAALERTWRASHPLPADEPRTTYDRAPDDGDDGESPMAVPERFPFPAAFRHLKSDFTHTDGPVLVAAPHPGLVVLLPPERAFAAFRLAETGGLPAPSEREAMLFRAWEPDQSLQSGPPWSPDVRFAEAAFTFDATGSSTLAFRALCTSPSVAKEQAEVMTSQVEQAQTISIGGAKLRLFDYIEFHADRERVKMSTHLFAEDIEWIVGMATK